LEIEDRRKKKERGAGSGEAGVPFEIGLWSRDEGCVWVNKKHSVILTNVGMNEGEGWEGG
jgi:hypothetical protein